MDRIGIDIDGCLNDLQLSFQRIFKRDYGVILPLNDYDVFKYINISSKEDIDKFWRKYEVEIFNESAKLNASKIIEFFSKLNIKIYIITAREYDCAELTIKWLKKENIMYDEIYFNSGNKVDVCTWKKIKYMIEDKSENAIALSENNIKVLLMDQEYNREIKHSNIIRCKDWLDVYDEINKVKK